MKDYSHFKRKGRLSEVWRRLRKSKSAMIGLTILSIIVLLTVFADFIVPYSTALEQNARRRLQWPSKEHWFGTDGYGRDLFARVLHGGRRSLTIGLASTAGALVAGWFIASIVSYYGGAVDNVVMRIMDIIASLPMTLMALAIVAALAQASRTSSSP